MFKSKARKQAEFLLKVEREKERLQQQEAAREAARQKTAEDIRKVIKACIDDYKAAYQQHPKTTIISTIICGVFVLGIGGIRSNSSEHSSKSTANSTPLITPSSSEFQADQSAKSLPLATNGFTFPQTSCGDKATGGNDTWYPVFIDGGDLSDIRSRYCADAASTIRQKTGKSAVQLASFTNYNRALEFAQAVGGEVGQPGATTPIASSPLHQEETVAALTEQQVKELAFTSACYERASSTTGLGNYASLKGQLIAQFQEEGWSYDLIKSGAPMSDVVHAAELFNQRLSDDEVESEMTEYTRKLTAPYYALPDYYPAFITSAAKNIYLPKYLDLVRTECTDLGNS
ncbi:MAG TPA: hypothetical protein V6D09_05215 [Leptolyngbyaceae cyanobacterium]